MIDCPGQSLTANLFLPPTEQARISEQFKRLCGGESMMSKAIFCELLKQLGWSDSMAEKYYR